MAQTEQTIQKFVGNLFAWEFRGRIHVSRPTQHLRNFSLHTLRARTQKKNSHGFDDFIEWCIVFVKLIKFWRRQWINYRNTNGRHVLHGGAISHQKPSDSIRYGSMWLIIVAPVLALELIFFFFFLCSVNWNSSFTIPRSPSRQRKKIAIHIDVQLLIKRTRGESGKDCEQTILTHPEDFIYNDVLVLVNAEKQTKKRVWHYLDTTVSEINLGIAQTER